MPQRIQRASRPLAAAALFLVIAVGIAFDAALAHQLVKRYQRVVHAPPPQEMRLTVPGDGVCPALPHWDPHHGIPFHAQRERLTVGATMGAGCPPSTTRV